MTRATVLTAVATIAVFFAVYTAAVFAIVLVFLWAGPRTDAEIAGLVAAVAAATLGVWSARVALNRLVRAWYRWTAFITLLASLVASAFAVEQAWGWSDAPFLLLDVLVGYLLLVRRLWDRPTLAAR